MTLIEQVNLLQLDWLSSKSKSACAYLILSIIVALKVQLIKGQKSNSLQYLYELIEGSSIQLISPNDWEWLVKVLNDFFYKVIEFFGWPARKIIILLILHKLSSTTTKPGVFFWESACMHNEQERTTYFFLLRLLLNQWWWKWVEWIWT